MLVLAFAISQVGQRSVMSVFWAIPPMLLGGTAAAAGIALINAIGNLGGFFGPTMMGWLRDVTGGYTGGLLVLAAALILEAVLVAIIEAAGDAARDARAAARRAMIGVEVRRSSGARAVGSFERLDQNAPDPDVPNPGVPTIECRDEHDSDRRSRRRLFRPAAAAQARRQAHARLRRGRMRGAAHRGRRHHPVPLRRQRLPLPHHARRVRSAARLAGRVPGVALGDPEPRARRSAAPSIRPACSGGTRSGRR